MYSYSKQVVDTDQNVSASRNSNFQLLFSEMRSHAYLWGENIPKTDSFGAPPRDTKKKYARFGSHQGDVIFKRDLTAKSSRSGSFLIFELFPS